MRAMRPVFQRHTNTIRRTTTLKNALTRCASASSALADLRVVDAANEASALVGGAWVRTARTFAVVDPGSGAEICDVADCGPEQARAAVDAASAALPAWAGATARERSDALREWHRRILAASEDIATLMTAECGKPLAEARGEVAYGASFVEWFAEEAPRVAGEVKANAGSDRRLLTVRQPVGVCAAITPWNFPVAMITRKVAPAVAAGAGKDRELPKGSSLGRFPLHFWTSDHLSEQSRSVDEFFRNARAENARVEAPVSRGPGRRGLPRRREAVGGHAALGARARAPRRRPLPRGRAQRAGVVAGPRGARGCVEFNHWFGWS